MCVYLSSLTSQAYTSKDLSGLKVEHSTEAFREERDIILTLKDKGQLRWHMYLQVLTSLYDFMEWPRLIDNAHCFSNTYNLFSAIFLLMHVLLLFTLK